MTKFESILVVCEGILCRGPVTAALLDRDTRQQVNSAGVAARVGSEMDPTAREVAAAAGLVCPPHRGSAWSGAATPT